MKYSDKQILDFLDENHYFQTKDSWDENSLEPDTSVWRFYAKKGTYDVRSKISDMMQRNGVQPDEI